MPDFVSEAKRIVGSIPVGNPEDLERYARQLDDRAERFDSGARHLRGIFENAGLYEGPLAVRLRSEAALSEAAIRGTLASEARAIAAEVRQQAGHLRSSQESWRQRLSRTARRLEEEFRKATD